MFDLNYIGVMAILENIAYHGELFFTVALSMHRLTIFIALKCHQFLNKPIFLGIHICFIWFMVLSFVTAQVLIKCTDISVGPKQNRVTDEQLNEHWTGK